MKRAIQKFIIKGNEDYRYFHTSESLNPMTGTSRMNLYDQAKQADEETDFQLDSNLPLSDLEQIKRLILIRIKVTQQEIFKIGELLIRAKQILHKNNMSFKGWIRENFDFSYETANNFMNVFKYCFAHRELVFKVPPSILYKLSSSSFSDELRDYLFEQGNIEEMTNGAFKDIVAKYNEGGIDAVREDVEEINDNIRIYKQTQYTFDFFKDALLHLKATKERIECRGGLKINAVVEFNEQIKQYQPEAAEIDKKLWDALDSAIKIMDEANSEAWEMLDKFQKSIKAKM